ncbi:MAG: hypothetical protein JWR26_4038 [Pedosphaera sp.]|nr:hypothetical protein [Pedosphaera sp.]
MKTEFGRLCAGEQPGDLRLGVGLRGGRASSPQPSPPPKRGGREGEDLALLVGFTAVVEPWRFHGSRTEVLADGHHGACPRLLLGAKGARLPRFVPLWPALPHWAFFFGEWKLGPIRQDVCARAPWGWISQRFSSEKGLGRVRASNTLASHMVENRCRFNAPGRQPNLFSVLDPTSFPYSFNFVPDLGNGNVFLSKWKT